jgi:putative flippase GtrA
MNTSGLLDQFLRFGCAGTTASANRFVIFYTHKKAHGGARFNQRFNSARAGLIGNQLQGNTI